LNSIRHVADRFADASMFGHVIKELEVVNIHVSLHSMADPTFIDYTREGKKG
jgi:hypothetical protein